jgi:hypothetical protein
MNQINSRSGKFRFALAMSLKGFLFFYLDLGFRHLVGDAELGESNRQRSVIVQSSLMIDSRGNTTTFPTTFQHFFPCTNNISPEKPKS